MAQPFNVDTHCTPEIQDAVGLRKAMCEVPRVGDKTCPGEQSYNQNSSWCISDTFTKDGARVLWNMITPARKNAPANREAAYWLALLAKIAERDPTPGMLDEIPNAGDKSFGVKFYVAPGSPLFEGFRSSHKFIAFVFTNMDDNSRVKWYNLTGREQYEWYRAWERAGRTHLAAPNETIGLHGTDLNRITNQAELNAAMLFSPSLGRRTRPANHAVTQHDWDEVRQRLFD